MLYDMVDARHAARAPDSTGVLGYWYNHGGLNNQKMALVGLILSGIRDRRPINLPYIYNKDLRTEQEHLVRLGHVSRRNPRFATRDSSAAGTRRVGIRRFSVNDTPPITGNE